MAKPRDRTDEAALWHRWRAASVSVEKAGMGPDALLLAAYADQRLPVAAAEALEEWLADHPDAISDVVAARRLGRSEEPMAPDAVMARAAALVSPGDAQILTFQQASRRRAGWRAAALWSGIAASLVVTSLIGFTLGSDAYISLAGVTSTTLGPELLDPPSGFFQNLGEEPSI